MLPSKFWCVEWSRKFKTLDSLVYFNLLLDEVYVTRAEKKLINGPHKHKSVILLVKGANKFNNVPTQFNNKLSNY